MAWGFVQSASGITFGTSISVTFTTANVSAGNKIIAVIASASSTAPSTVQDGGGNPWTQIAAAINASPTAGLWLYALDVPAADAGTKPTITASGLGSNGLSMVIQEISGLAPGNTTAMRDGTAGTLTGTASSTGSPSYASTAVSEYLVCCYGDHQGASPAFLGSPWTADPANTASQSHASVEYRNSTGGAETSGWTGASANGWAVLTVAFKIAILPPAAGPVLRVPHPKFLDLLTGQAHQRLTWHDPPVADLTIAYASSASGVDTYNVDSPWNIDLFGSQREHMRVLKPVTPDPDYPHAFLLMLPVDPDQNTGFGDPIGVAQAITANDSYNLTVVQPGYALKPSSSVAWYGDHPSNPGISEEKFTLLILDWVKRNLATTGTEKTYLIGFSRSGLGAQFLQFRHPDLFAAAASWDTPFAMTDYDGTDPVFGGIVGGHPEYVYGTSSSFKAKYQLSAAHLDMWAASGQFAVNRVWIGTGPDFGVTESNAYDSALTTAGIPHTYTFSNTGESHAWHTDWVSAALSVIIPVFSAPAGAATATASAPVPGVTVTARPGAAAAAGTAPAPSVFVPVITHPGTAAASATAPAPGGFIIDLTVAVGATVSRAQAVPGTASSRAQVSNAGAVTGNGTDAANITDDGTEAGPTTVNRNP
jgi:hypothetical protein